MRFYNIFNHSNPNLFEYLFVINDHDRTKKMTQYSLEKRQKVLVKRRSQLYKYLGKIKACFYPFKSFVNDKISYPILLSVYIKSIKSSQNEAKHVMQ